MNDMPIGFGPRSTAARAVLASLMFAAILCTVGCGERDPVIKVIEMKEDPRIKVMGQKSVEQSSKGEK